VLVSAHPRLIEAVPDYAEKLRAVAGNVEIIIDDSGSYEIAPEKLAGVDAIIGFCDPTTIANSESSLLWLHSYTVGMDRCAGLADEQLERLVFTNAKRLSGPAIAEHSMAMLLALSRGLPPYLHSQAESNWDRSHAQQVRFGELQGKTLLVAGLGGIGTEVAWRAHGLGMRVIATRNSSRSGPDYVDYVGLADELHKLAGEADVVVNALPLTRETRGLFNREFFAAIKPGAIFISVGRGQSTVTADLLTALEKGTLYGAGLDVTDPEPLPASSPLWKLPNVIITPHVSAAGSGSARRNAVIAIENLRRYIAGEPLLNLVNMRAGY
jgi:phosphoglycerate dehydrogenase-like enzyme